MFSLFSSRSLSLALHPNSSLVPTDREQERETVRKRRERQREREQTTVRKRRGRQRESERETVRKREWKRKTVRERETARDSKRGAWERERDSKKKEREMETVRECVREKVRKKDSQREKERQWKRKTVRERAKETVRKSERKRCYNHRTGSHQNLTRIYRVSQNSSQKPQNLSHLTAVFHTYIIKLLTTNNSVFWQHYATPETPPTCTQFHRFPFCFWKNPVHTNMFFFFVKYLCAQHKNASKTSHEHTVYDRTVHHKLVDQTPQE